MNHSNAVAIMNRSMNHSNGDPPPLEASVAILLQEWILRARTRLATKDYLARSVDVALGLADRLCLIAGADGDDDVGSGVENDGSPRNNDDSLGHLWSDLGDDTGFANFLAAMEDDAGEGCGRFDSPSAASARVEIQDIEPENILVVPANDIIDDTSCASNYIVKGVTIRAAANSNSKPSKGGRPSSQDVCFALGRILFELFSGGDPLLLIDLDSAHSGCRSNSNADHDAFSDWLLLEDAGLEEIAGSDSNPRAPKRSLMHSAASSTAPNRNNGPGPQTSMKAKFYLQDRGLPASVCRLVADLLENKGGDELYISDTALCSVEEARSDLARMKGDPCRFLHDETDPERALKNTGLFGAVSQIQMIDDGADTGEPLYGREEEMNTIMDVAGRVVMHTPAVPRGADDIEEGQHGVGSGTFLCEAVFLSGHSGSGKSTIVRRLVSICDANDWCMLVCKFDRQAAPLSALLQSVDSFFGKISMTAQQQGGKEGGKETFYRISRSILSSIDSESLAQLCVLLPNLRELFPIHMTGIDDPRSASPIHPLGELISDRTNGKRSSASSSGAMGSGRNRLNHLLHIIIRAICSGGNPVLVCLEDTQWADAATLDIIGDFIQTAGYGNVVSADGQPLRGGLLYVGSFRDNEVEDDGCVIKQIKCMERSMGNINVNRFVIGELTEVDVNGMLSFKFCLPTRHTRELAQLVYQKTRGYPMFTVEFLRSIIRMNSLTFSVRDRRWVWDETSIDMQLISDDVVQLLTEKLKRLPQNVVQTLMVVSCFGFQINLSVIELLDSGQFNPDMMGSLNVAMREGIIERAGPVFAFSHDMLQETSYKLIPVDERKQLHKKIAQILVQDPEIATKPELCTLAADQVNICKDADEILGPGERTHFAWLNLAAGKHSIRTSSYEQARAYFEAGISLLNADKWDKQYSLTLQLYEWSVVVCFMDGKQHGILSRLNDILSNAKSFDGKLNARAMLAKYYVSQARFADGFKEVVEVLSDLGEVFPKEFDQTNVISEIKATLPLLEGITKEKICDLPAMTDVRKLNAMMFMGLLTTFSIFYSPMFVHLLSCRMIRLTFQFGYCENTIDGLVCYVHGLWLYMDAVDMIKRINGISESLIRGDRNEHSLRARLTLMSMGVKTASEPAQAAAESIYGGYKSATSIGDVDNAMICGLGYLLALFYCPANGVDLQRKFLRFFHEMAKHKRIGLLHSAQSFFNSVNSLIGNKGSHSISAKIEMKSNEELYHMAKDTQNNYLMHHVMLNGMFEHFYFRKYLDVTEFAEKYKMNSAGKRSFDILAAFYEGISALVLARDTKQEKWRKIGENALKSVAQYVEYSVWNFENKFNLLQAELLYLNKRHVMAKLSYQSAIQSAHDHKFVLEEALAHELYGIYLVENNSVAEGMGQLSMAVETYRQWGAMKKADDVQDFIQLIQ